MTRLGWSILVLILVVAGAFASMLSVGGARPSETRLSVARAMIPQIRERDDGLLAVPVVGVARTSIADSWGDEREGGARHHHGTDIVAPEGTPVAAVAAGTVERLYDDARGGVTLYQRSANRRWMYYYAHLRGYARGLHEGQKLRPGDALGFVGDTGDAGRGNFHLHFGLARMTPDQHWWQGEDVNPYPRLRGGRVLGRSGGGG